MLNPEISQTTKNHIEATLLNNLMKQLAILLTILLAATTLKAQQALWDRSAVKSPEINPDNSVTFRLYAPEAKSVNVNGDFQAAPGQMIKNENGVWEFTTSSLPGELYSYSFDVDNVRILDPSNVYTVRDVATLFNYFIIDGESGSNYKVNDVPHGSVSRVWYESPGLGKKRRLAVYTPPGYEDSGESYPVFYLLHGAGGDEEAWLALGRTAQILDNLIAAGAAEPMIVVMTNGNAAQTAAPGEGSDGLVVPSFDISRMNRGEFETAFPDVVNFVDAHFRTKPDKAHRAIAGLSMGGYHSLHISKQYPDLFDYVGLFSAAIFPPQGTSAPIYDNFEGKLRTQFEKNPKLYWIAIGDQDFLYNDNAKFRKILDENHLSYTYLETPDGHIWKNWRKYLTEFTPKLFKSNL